MLETQSWSFGRSLMSMFGKIQVRISCKANNLLISQVYLLLSLGIVIIPVITFVWTRFELKAWWPRFSLHWFCERSWKPQINDFSDFIISCGFQQLCIIFKTRLRLIPSFRHVFSNHYLVMSDAHFLEFQIHGGHQEIKSDWVPS